jgi:hypothetical protein
MYSTAARAKSTSTTEEGAGDEEDVADADEPEEVCEGVGDESKTIPLLVASEERLETV